MRFTSKPFSSAMLLLILFVSLAPPGAAHWTVPNPSGSETHEHTILWGPKHYRVSFFAQRICHVDGSGTPGIYIWSYPDGSCPAGSSPAFPPFRGFQGIFPYSGCVDLTEAIPTAPYFYDPGTAAQGSYFKMNPHVGTNPSSIAEDVTVDNGDVSDYFSTASAAGTFLPTTVPANGPPPFVGADGTGGIGNGLPTDTSTAQRPQAALRFIAEGPASITQLWRTVLHGNDKYDEGYDLASSQPYSTARGLRTGLSVPGFDNGDNDLETGVGEFCFTYAIDSSPNGVGDAQTEASATPLPYPGTGPGPFGGDWDGCDHTVTASDGCDAPAAVYPTAVYQCAGADLNDPNAAPATSTTSGAFSPAANEWNAHPIGNDGVFDTTAPASPNSLAPPVTYGYATDTCGAVPGPGVSPLVQSTRGMAPVVGGPTNGLPVEGLLLSAASLASITHPVSYTVCNDVAEQGCTNIPVELFADVPNLAQGHVFASLGSCVFDPASAPQTVIDTYAPGENPIVHTPHEYRGVGTFWGSLQPNGHPCWPERLRYCPALLLFAPSSECGPWMPDASPATGRDVERLTGIVDLLEIDPVAGTSYCTPGAVVPTGCPDPFFSNSVKTPGWTGGWAAVFTTGSGDCETTENLSTGVDAGGNPYPPGVPDPKWYMTKIGGTATSPVPAFTVKPNGFWATTGGAAWVNPFGSNSNTLGGDYEYNVDFHVPCIPSDCSKIHLNFDFAADDDVQFKLNGNPIGSLYTSAYSSLHHLDHVGCAFFKGGATNTLTAVVMNSGLGPTGLLLHGTFTIDA